MNEQTITQDRLAKEIDALLASMSRNDFRIACHIGTRTSLYLLQSGLVPCIHTGKRTRCYKIAKADVAACRIFSSYSSLFSISHPVPRRFLLPRHKSPSAQNSVKSMAHLLMTTTTETKKGRCQKSAMSFFQAYERKAGRYHKRRTEMPADTCFAKAHSGQTILDITDTLYFETDSC